MNDDIYTTGSKLVLCVCREVTKCSSLDPGLGPVGSRAATYGHHEHLHVPQGFEKRLSRRKQQSRSDAEKSSQGTEIPVEVTPLLSDFYRGCLGEDERQTIEILKGIFSANRSTIIRNVLQDVSDNQLFG